MRKLDRSGDARTPAKGFRRRQFLDALKRFAPEVAVALREDVWPAYQTNQPGRHTAAGLRRCEELQQALFGWGKCFNLLYSDNPEKPEWVIRMALESMWVWHLSPNSAAAGLLRPPTYAFWYPHSDAEQSFVFDDPGWSMETETAPQFKKRVTQRFKSHLESYIERLNTIANERGWAYGREIDSRKYFEWLVRHQVRETSTEIAEKEAAGITPDYIRVTTDRLRKEIDLPPAPTTRRKSHRKA